MFSVLFGFCLLNLVIGDEPILHLMPTCPTNSSLFPNIAVKADVPAYVVAKCANGNRKVITNNDVDFSLAGSFDQSYDGPYCRFFKKDGANTYHVDVKIGWGEVGSHVITRTQIKTVTCAYDNHGHAIAKETHLDEWFLNPEEKQTLHGGEAPADFTLQLVDVLNRPVKPDMVNIGRKVRLLAKEDSGSIQAFRALSCVAKNNASEYSILRAGCGDGLVFPKNVGFTSAAGTVFSPYFNIFRLHSGIGVQFDCTFTVCEGNCEGDSCANQVRKKRSLLDKRVQAKTGSAHLGVYIQ